MKYWPNIEVKILKRAIWPSWTIIDPPTKQNWPRTELRRHNKDIMTFAKNYWGSKKERLTKNRVPKSQKGRFDPLEQLLRHRQWNSDQIQRFKDSIRTFWPPWKIIEAWRRQGWSITNLLTLLKNCWIFNEAGLTKNRATRTQYRSFNFRE